MIAFVAACCVSWNAESTLVLEPAITRREIEAHTRFLASDELGGRSTATAQAAAAARYLAETLARAGVKPAGDDGSYLQRVPLLRTVAKASATASWKNSEGAEQAWSAGVDFEAPFAPLEAVDLPLFVVRAETDLAALPKERCVVFLDARPSDRRALRERLDRSRVVFALVPGNTTAGQPRAFRPHERLERAADAQAGEIAQVRLHGAALEAVRSGLVKRVSLATHVTSEATSCSNVVARIDARQASETPLEAVVLSAHYDHLAHASAESKPGEDTIFNGADDDASGCAVLLELAGALAVGQAPERTLVFLFATGEEIGLFGTWEYLDRPYVPLDRTVLNLNFEMVGRPDAQSGGVGKLWLTGFERSNLGPEFATASLPIVADTRLEQHFFERSDNIAFVRRGIVGQTLSSYDMHADYHTPRDEAQKLDYAHMEAVAKSSLEATRLVSRRSFVPRWLAGYEPKKR